MSKYKPDIQIYYGTKENKDKLIPAPNITISLEYNYSNDSIIGYTYVVNLSGFITALDLREIDYDQEITEPDNYAIGAVIDHAYKLRNILSQNGSILYITKGDDKNTNILMAKGGILRSFNIDESPNNWMHYVGYTASLEFTNIDFGSEIDTPFLSSDSYNSNSIIDIGKYKIKSFNDSWSLTFDENDSFSKVFNNEYDLPLHMPNNSFNIEYTISAVGKHFFVYDNAENDSTQRKLLPAWEQAKNFVQDRLYKQVNAIIKNILKSTDDASCNPEEKLNTLHNFDKEGLFKDFDDYKIYNEKISCDTSESEGSFSATYSAIVKNIKGDTGWTSPETKHTVQKNTTVAYAKGIPVVNISLNGTIQGLIEGGLIKKSEPIKLPNSGSFFISQDQVNTQYNNAKKLLDKIYSETSYNFGLGDSGKRDIDPDFKKQLGITMEVLGIPVNPLDPISDPPHPISFNLTHDYFNGNITYAIEYSSEKFCGRKINDISITTNNPNKVVAVFNIPSSNNCPLIQELGTYTNRIVNISIKGTDLSDYGQPPIQNELLGMDIVSEITKELTLTCPQIGSLPITLPLPGTYIITQQQYTRNPIDGSFSVDISYICNKLGCPI